VGAQSDEILPRQWVDLQDGEVSLAFEQIPVHYALQAFHARTGFFIAVPAQSESKLLNFRLTRQPFEPAVRSLLSNIGFHNFAMVYDQKGRPHSAVALGASAPLATVPARETVSRPLTIEEREQLKKDLERWNELKQEERGRIEERLRGLPPSDDREILVREYGRQVLGLK
jgi:hypothetical protein